MLILGRKYGQSIYINEDIKITLLNQNGKTTYIGIDAPKEYNIVREELLLPQPGEKNA